MDAESVIKALRDINYRATEITKAVNAGRGTKTHERAMEKTVKLLFSELTGRQPTQEEVRHVTGD
jgi:hypothetical protein